MIPLVKPTRKALIPIWEEECALEIPILHLPRRRSARAFRAGPPGRLGLRSPFNAVNQSNPPGATRTPKFSHVKHCPLAS